MPKTKTLQQNFKSTAVLEQTVVELKKENQALKETVSKLLNEVDRLRGVDKEKVVRLELTPEQEILEMQIHRLQQVSRERALTLDETRTLDLHIKNKRLLDDKSTVNAEYSVLPADISDDELLRIAEGVEEKPKKSRRSKSKTS